MPSIMSREISDLVQLMKAESERRISELGEDQEREIVGDTELNDDDAGLPIGSKQWSTAVFAVRQWEYGLFDPLRRA